jgi:hypothetical protein
MTFQILDFVTQKGTGGQSIYGSLFEGMVHHLTIN